MSEINTGLHYPISLDEIPTSWIAAYVGEFCDSIQSGFACGQHSDSDIGVPHLRPMNISRDGVLNFEVIKYVPNDFDERRLCEDDVLFNNTNSPELIGKTAYVTQKGHGLAFSNHMTRLRFHRGVNSKYGAFQLHYLWMARYFLHGCVKHVNQASVSASELAKSVPFVVPPEAEQHRIVAKIEELFSELDQGIENLKTAREQLKVYRQALLKHAFEGKLTVQWREERRANSAHTVIPAKAGIHANEKLDSRPTLSRGQALRGGDELCGLNDEPLETAAALLARIQTEREQRYQQQLQQWEQSKSPSVPLLQRGKPTSAASTSTTPPFAKGGLGGISKPKAPKPLPPLTAEELAELPELPEGWGWAKAEDVCSSVRDGTHDTPKYVSQGVPLVTSKNLRDGKIDFSDTQFISEEDHAQISIRSGVDKGDVLYAMIGTIGNPVVVTGVEIFSIKNVALFKGNMQFLDSRFLSFWLGSAICDKILTALELLKGTTQKFIPLGNLRILPVPMCSLEEQKVIVQLLDEKLSEADQLDQTLTASLQQAEALRQSILKRAFSGQLVPQDSNDEPAAALLARIQAEKTRHAEKPKKFLSRSKRNE